MKTAYKIKLQIEYEFCKHCFVSIMLSLYPSHATKQWQTTSNPRNLYCTLWRYSTNTPHYNLPIFQMRILVIMYSMCDLTTLTHFGDTCILSVLWSNMLSAVTRTGLSVAIWRPGSFEASFITSQVRTVEVFWMYDKDQNIIDMFFVNFAMPWWLRTQTSNILWQFPAPAFNA